MWKGVKGEKEGETVDDSWNGIDDRRRSMGGSEMVEVEELNHIKSLKFALVRRDAL